MTTQQKRQPDLSEPRQLVFDLPHLDAYEAEDFLLSACNQSAADMIDRWPDWPAPVLVINGPAASGKSHLAAVWRERSNAEIIKIEAQNLS